MTANLAAKILPRICVFFGGGECCRGPTIQQKVPTRGKKKVRLRNLIEKYKQVIDIHVRLVKLVATYHGLHLPFLWIFLLLPRWHGFQSLSENSLILQKRPNKECSHFRSYRPAVLRTNLHIAHINSKWWRIPLTSGTLS